MSAYGPKLRLAEGDRILFFCPGCKQPHAIKKSNGTNGGWDFNGDKIKPTFAPSVLVRYGSGPTDDRCHSFVRQGTIQFLTDCSHNLAGHTVPLPDWPSTPIAPDQGQ